MIQFLLGVLTGVFICAAGLILALTSKPDDDLSDQRSDFGNPFGGGV